MSEMAPRPDAPAPRKMTALRFSAMALVSAAIAIAITLWLSNGASQARECPVQADRAAAIDAVALGALAALNGTGQGRGYEKMAFKDDKGQDVTIGDFKGKALLVNFWASWCVPCRAEMPALDNLATSANSDTFMVLPINLDIGEGGLEKAKKFLDEGQFKNLPLYADSTFEAFKALQREAVALGLPATLLLDENGCEIAVLQGPAEWDTDEGKAVIRALVESRPKA